MGLVQLPRVYFKGSLYWNPSTMNNNDYQPTYDTANARLDWGWMERHGVRCAEDFDRYAIQPQVLNTPNSGADSAVFPDCPPAEWNYYGGNTCGFIGTDMPRIEWPQMFSKPNDPVIVTGYTDADGNYVGSDPWISAPLRMNADMVEAKLVDVDPICPWSSQIFVDSISLGDAGNGLGFAARTAGRAHARWVNFFRNRSKDVMIAGVASTVFQLGLPRSTLKFFGGDPKPGSLAAQLLRALEAPGVQGLMVRFVAYTTIYFQGDAFTGVRPTQPKGGPQFDYFPVMAKLYARYAEQLAAYTQGTLADPPPVPVNRAYSKTVGWIAPWMAGELRSVPGGRILFCAPSPTSLGPVAIDYGTEPSSPGRIARLAVDLGSATPETDGRGTKMDVGTLAIGLLPLEGSGIPRVIARIPYAGGYDQEAYEKTSGVVDIPAAKFLTPLSVADAQSNLFCITFTPPGGKPKTSLESAFVAQTDERGVYLNEPNAPWMSDQSADVSTIAVQVRYLGGAPPAGTALGVVQYSPDPPNFNEGGLLVVSRSSPQNQSPYLDFVDAAKFSGDGYIVVNVPPVKGGEPFATASFGVRGVRSGCPNLGFYPIPPGGTPTWQPPQSVAIPFICSLFYAVVRVLPFHNSMAQAFEEWLKSGPMIDLVTQRAFDEVFKTYYLMYPVMRFIRDAPQFQAWRGRICEITDPARFDTAAYMPVTRAMSAGQRRILELWNSYADGQIPTTPKPLARLARRA